MSTPKWIEFRDVTDKYPPRKTKIFGVINKEHDTVLGMITWHAPWRKYCFFPEPNRVFESTCMNDIVAFMDGLMEAWKLAKAVEHMNLKLDAIRAQVAKEVSTKWLNENHPEIKLE